MKFERVPTIVDAAQFKPEGRRSNLLSVELEECYCADLAQDGRYCPRHQTPPVLVFRVESGRGERIYPGQFLVTFPNEQVKVYEAAEFEKLFRKVTS